ncbi:hypothetical protein [Streptomyces sp. NPDC099088]|uniref:hypothetical protein n=1 Tax=Streptomyces sp. NPDC099088 TaxID=3366101 RepID=UPI00381381A1
MSHRFRVLRSIQTLVCVLAGDRSPPGVAGLSFVKAGRKDHRRMGMMELAARQASLSRCRYRLGAVLVVGSRVLAASPNLRRNSPTVDFRHATFHAEEAVLRRAPRTAGAVVYVARVNAEGSRMLAKPCPRCQQALAAAGVSRVYYTADSAEIHSLNIASGFQEPRPAMQGRITGRSRGRWS